MLLQFFNMIHALFDVICVRFNIAGQDMAFLVTSEVTDT